ncbi:hypothetical protein L6164_029035 [Bauhinia variegata]|uniref:Uncharacterized protein n=1 Tax=Bauhinia variegata TaxID=167791 RepID=A0ACB9L8F2_BAUVA|nr:hypothetical protein L6164_029035 [Bauhinia variegata]
MIDTSNHHRPPLTVAQFLPPAKDLQDPLLDDSNYCRQALIGLRKNLKETLKQLSATSWMGNTISDDNLEGELGRLLGKLELFKKLDEYAKQQFMSDLIKRSRNQTNDSSEDVGPSQVSADQDSGESSAPRFRYGEPFPLDVENESVTVTGRQMHLEPPREPSPLFVEYKDRRASLELQRDDSGELFIVRRIRVEQIWMELHETAPSGFDDPPSYVNVPPEPEPSAAAGSYRCGEPFPNNVRYETTTVTAHRVHREAAPPEVAGQFLLFVEARNTEPFTDTLRQLCHRLPDSRAAFVVGISTRTQPEPDRLSNQTSNSHDREKSEDQRCK